MTKDEAVSLKNPAKVRWDIFLHATTMRSKKTKQYIPVFYQIIDILSIWLY